MLLNCGVGEDSWESLDCKEIQPVNSKGNQSWVLIGRTDIEAETPVLWPPDAKDWLFGEDPDAGKDWRQEEKGMTEDEMAGWHHWCDGHEFEQALRVGDGQGNLGHCSPWGLSQTGLSDWTELINVGLLTQVSNSAAYTFSTCQKVAVLSSLAVQTALRLLQVLGHPSWSLRYFECKLLVAGGLFVGFGYSSPSSQTFWPKLTSGSSLFKHQSADLRCPLTPGPQPVFYEHPGHGNAGVLRPGPHGDGWCRLHRRSDWRRALAVRLFGLTRTHQTIPCPLSQTQAPPPFPLLPAIPSLLEPSGLALQAQLTASGFRLLPRVPHHLGFGGADGLCVDCVYQKWGLGAAWMSCPPTTWGVSPGFGRPAVTHQHWPVSHPLRRGLLMRVDLELSCKDQGFRMTVMKSGSILTQG